MKPFDVIDDLSYSKKNLMAEDREACLKAHSPYLTNRHFSYHVDTLMYANDMNVLHHVDPDMHYRFMFDVVRPKKRFSKWHKPQDMDRVKALSEWYRINTTRARELLRVLTTDEVDSIMKRLGSGDNEGTGRIRGDKAQRS
jgi:hypothetical protein